MTVGEMAMAESILKGEKSDHALLRRHPSEKIFGIQITAGIANHKPQLVGKPSDVEKHSIPEDDIIIEVGADIVWRATVDGFPDTQRGPEWVTEILNKVVGAEEEKEVIEPENQEVIN